MENKTIILEGVEYNLVPVEENVEENESVTFYYACDSDCGYFEFNVLINNDGEIWKELWRADPYHIAMGRDWLVKPYEIMKAKFIRVGLLSRAQIPLAAHDERVKGFQHKFYLNSVFVYSAN